MNWLPLAGIVLAVFMLMLDATVVTVAGPGSGRWAPRPAMGGERVPDRHGRRAAHDGRSRRSLRQAQALPRFGDRLRRGVTGLRARTHGRGTHRRARRAGPGWAAIFATTLALIGQSYPGAARGTAFAVRGTAAGVLGPVIGGLLTEGLGWRWIFFLNLPVAVAAAVIGWPRLPRAEELARGRRIVIPGPVLWAVSLVYALLHAGSGAGRTRWC
ncbi:hypothetical protein GCM10017786_70790 [Amycolatopsis deserti]|uniref:MFS transporter n=1 Tax=Amycolatopsis deserti TaxID=185696 RepID=A0ABQ3JKS0_9PSEU|nr:hypothetical protein GCM10017786_70790 [Amycolatopsis deserti]